MANAFWYSARSAIARLFGSQQLPLLDDMSEFLKDARGIIHVGANKGQERHLYDALGLNVIWIEPIPAICKKLRKNVRFLPKQKVLEALLLDRPGQSVVLHVANNGGASSSIFDFKLHKDIWPDVNFTHDVELVSTTLPFLLDESAIDLSLYNVLIIDTQGAELLILQGAADILRAFDFIQAEAADFEAYAGGATRAQIDSFLNEAGFDLFRSRQFAKHEKGGAYFDLIYKRR